jgi:hypothetical protein
MGTYIGHRVEPDRFEMKYMRGRGCPLQRFLIVPAVSVEALMTGKDLVTDRADSVVAAFAKARGDARKGNAYFTYRSRLGIRTP